MDAYAIERFRVSDLDMIANANNMSARTLNRLFASEGTTPIRWLWQQRLAASFKALAQGQISQTIDAALTYGFSELFALQPCLQGRVRTVAAASDSSGALKSSDLMTLTTPICILFRGDFNSSSFRVVVVCLTAKTNPQNHWVSWALASLFDCDAGRGSQKVGCPSHPRPPA
jgi:AraC-like DNA-binding protein